MSRTIEQINELLQTYVQNAKSGVNTAYYAGLGKEEGAMTYAEYAKELEVVQLMVKIQIDRLMKLQSHICEYNEDDYCVYCGRDGRA